MIKWFDCSRWMQCEARSQVNQGESEGVDLRPRLKMSPLICQEIARNAPPQVVFFTKNETIPDNYVDLHTIYPCCSPDAEQQG